MHQGDMPASEMHSSHGMIDVIADVWIENDTILFRASLHAQSLEIAEEYLRKIYPNISTLYVYEGTVQ